MSITKKGTRYEHLGDAEILTLAGGMGPALIGQELHDLAAAIRKETGGGVFGPAITDPDYAAKQKALREARERSSAEHDDDDDEAADSPEDTPSTDDEPTADDGDAWSQVSLSGAKMLAQQFNVSYVPRVKRAQLIDQLIAAGVKPPVKHADDDEGDGN